MRLITRTIKISIVLCFLSPICAAADHLRDLTAFHPSTIFSKILNYQDTSNQLALFPKQKKLANRKESTRAISIETSPVSWTWNESGVLIEWLIVGDLVKVELYRNGQFAADLSGWIENSGELLYTDNILSSIGYGDGFSIKISNNLDTYVWSNEFEVYALNVIQPSGGEILHAGEIADIILEWGEWPVPLNMDVYAGNRFVERIMEALPSGTLSYQWQDTIPSDWQMGDDYRIRLSDANGFYGWSDYFSVVQDWYTICSIANEIEPGNSFRGRFRFLEDVHIYRFSGEELFAYYFLRENDTPFYLEILDSDNEVLLCPEFRTDDQNEGEGIHWDCRQNGEYIVRITSTSPDIEEYKITMHEVPGWAAAVSLDSDQAVEGSIDYPGDIDYYTIRVTGNLLWKNKCRIELNGLEHAVLLQVDTKNHCPDQIAEGINDVTIGDNLGILSGSRDMYFGVCGSEGFYSIDGTQKIDAGMTSLNFCVEMLIMGGIGFLTSLPLSGM